MKAMILAAGRGERMRPLTDNLPKPLLKVGDQCLIEYHIRALVEAGIREIVINHAYLGEKIVAQLGNGRRYDASISYSAEGETPLETGGGIHHALPLLGHHQFLVLNADIWTDYSYEKLARNIDGLAHLILVPNPSFKRKGDFAIDGGLVRSSGEELFTFSGIGVYHPALFANINRKSFPLAPLLRQAMHDGQVTGEIYTGKWFDIGTPERLQDIKNEIRRGR